MSTLVRAINNATTVKENTDLRNSIAKILVRKQGDLHLTEDQQETITNVLTGDLQSLVKFMKKHMEVELHSSEKQIHEGTPLAGYMSYLFSLYNAVRPNADLLNVHRSMESFDMVAYYFMIFNVNDVTEVLGELFTAPSRGEVPFIPPADPKWTGKTYFTEDKIEDEKKTTVSEEVSDTISDEEAEHMQKYGLNTIEDVEASISEGVVPRMLKKLKEKDPDGSKREEKKKAFEAKKEAQKEARRSALNLDPEQAKTFGRAVHGKRIGAPEGNAGTEVESREPVDEMQEKHLRKVNRQKDDASVIGKGKRHKVNRKEDFDDSFLDGYFKDQADERLKKKEAELALEKASKKRKKEVKKLAKAAIRKEDKEAKVGKKMKKKKKGGKKK